MRTLHIAPGDSAGGSLRRAILDSGRDEDVLPYRDDLSCGPVSSDDPSARAAWWAPHYQAPEVDRALRAFWDRIATTDDRLVVWFGRHSAMELAFFLSWTDRLGDRSYDVVDVTGLRLPFTKHDGSPAVTQPTQAVSSVPADGLSLLLGSERPFAAEERDEMRLRWHQLKEENAPFRVVTATGLASAPLDHFDALLMERATTQWQRINRIIGDVMGHNSEPYIQVDDLMLLTRVVALIGEGKLCADGDPWDMRSGHVRLPG
jgi:hypothetical protein